MPKAKNITLVTGASGHLGPALVRKLVGRGDAVRALVRTGDLDVAGVEVLRGDILDADTVRAAVKDVSLVYHLAAVVDYAPAPRNLLYNVNVLGTKNLLDNFTGRVIYQSTSSVYGYSMKENPATPTTPYNPSTDYGRTKMEAEQLVLKRGGIVIRAPVIFGEGFNEPFNGLLRQIQKGSMVIIGPGNNHLQWVCVDDLVDALVLAGEKGNSGQVYLVATKQPTTQEELYTLLAGLLKVPPPHKHISIPAITVLAHLEEIKSGITGKPSRVKPEYIQRLASDRQFDISKAEKELGFHPKVNYEQWAKDLVSEYTHHQLQN